MPPGNRASDREVGAQSGRSLLSERRTPMSTHRVRSLLALFMLLAVASCSSPAEPQATPGQAKAAADYAALDGLSRQDQIWLSGLGHDQCRHGQRGRPDRDRALSQWSNDQIRRCTSGRSRRASPPCLSASRSPTASFNSLDQTLAELLPKYQQHMKGAEGQATLRQLMDMTAGFPGDEPVENIWKVFSYGGDPLKMILADGLANAARHHIRILEPKRTPRHRGPRRGTPPV